MVYVSVKQNELGEWEVLKYLSSVYNQRSPITDMTVSDVSQLDAEGRLLHGFWTQTDEYVGTGEFKEFDKKVVVFDDVQGNVKNTYHYKLMDLAIIREEMKNRVRSHRMQLSNSVYKKDLKEYNLSSDGRLELQGLVIEILLDPSIESVSIRLSNGDDAVLTAAELKALFLEISIYRDGLYDTEMEIIHAIDSALDYDAIRLAAKWGEDVL